MSVTGDKNRVRAVAGKRPPFNDGQNCSRRVRETHCVVAGGVAVPPLTEQGRTGRVSYCTAVSVAVLFVVCVCVCVIMSLRRRSPSVGSRGSGDVMMGVPVSAGDGDSHSQCSSQGGEREGHSSSEGVQQLDMSQLQEVHPDWVEWMREQVLSGGFGPETEWEGDARSVLREFLVLQRARTLFVYWRKTFGAGDAGSPRRGRAFPLHNVTPHVHTHAHAQTNAHTHTLSLSLSFEQHTETHTYIYTHTYMHKCRHAYIYTYTHHNIHTCIHT